MDELALLMKEKMIKTISNLKETLSTLRTGRASASMLDKIQAEYYGDMMPINQISQVSCPEPRQILVKPYDKNDVKSIISAINAADLGLNPINDGDSIRINIPALTEEKRKELAKKAKTVCEEAKVAVRNIRRDTMDGLKKSEEYSDDLKKRIEEDIQKVTDEQVKAIDVILEAKEKDIFTI